MFRSVSVNGVGCWRLNHIVLNVSTNHHHSLYRTDTHAQINTLTY